MKKGKLTEVDRVNEIHINGHDVNRGREEGGWGSIIM